MSASHSEGEKKSNEEGEKQGDEPAPSDEEDDSEGFFLEPVGNNVNIAEKIAEANKKLFEEEEEEEEEEDESRPRKVKFSDDLVNFEPASYSDDDCTESAQNSIISEDDSEIKPSELHAEKVDASEVKSKAPEIEEIPEEIIKEVTVTEDFSVTDRNSKFILVLLPKEQNSSCESIIGEEVQAESKETEPEPEKMVKIKLTRPKSAKKSCEVSKISPNLNYSSSVERTSWRTNRKPLLKTKKSEKNEKKGSLDGEMKVEVKGRGVKKINIGDVENVKPETLRCCDNRPRSSYWGKKTSDESERPKTAPMRRTCCVVKTELPKYNGLRSEYGLSADQLEERKQETLKIAKQRKQVKIKEKQEEARKRERNEEMFQKWLFNKTKKSVGRKTTPKLTDTLARSDVYIQTHAVYATKRSVPYAVDYSISKKLRENRVKQKKILIEKFLDKVSPYFKKSFNIYLGDRP